MAPIISVFTSTTTTTTAAAVTLTLIIILLVFFPESFNLSTMPISDDHACIIPTFVFDAELNLII